MATHNWYYASGGQPTGPVSLSRLQELIASGQIQPSDWVWEEGRPAWFQAMYVAPHFLTDQGESLPPPLPQSVGRPIVPISGTPLAMPAMPRLVFPANPPKDPFGMAVLSLLIVGLGQIVLGQKAKGVAMLLGAIILGVLTAGLAAPVIWLIAAVDAYKVAKKLKERGPVGEWEWF